MEMEVNNMLTCILRLYELMRKSMTTEHTCTSVHRHISCMYLHCSVYAIQFNLIPFHSDILFYVKIQGYSK